MKRTARLFRQHVAQTVYNFQKYQLRNALASLPFEPRSLLCFTTNDSVSQVVEQTTDLQQELPDLSVVIASNPKSKGVETVSHLWLSSRLGVRSWKPLETPSLDQWDINKTKLRLQFLGTSLELFPEGEYFESINSFSWLSVSMGLHSPIQNVSELELELPMSVNLLRHLHNLKPLHKEAYTITKADGNVIYELNNRGACSVLIDLLKNRSVSFDAYAKVRDSNGTSKIHHITAGSPLYQEDNAPIVLKDAQLEDAQTAELLIVDLNESIDSFDLREKFVLESIDLGKPSPAHVTEDTVVDNHILFVSENGFAIDGLTHSSLNETVQLDIVEP